MTTHERGRTMNAPQEHLPACPFCGSALRIHSYSKRIGKAAPHIFQTAQVKCKKQSCGMSGPLAKGEGCRKVAADRFIAGLARLGEAAR